MPLCTFVAQRSGSLGACVRRTSHVARRVCVCASSVCMRCVCATHVRCMCRAHVVRSVRCAAERPSTRRVCPACARVCCMHTQLDTSTYLPARATYAERTKRNASEHSPADHVAQRLSVPTRRSITQFTVQPPHAARLGTNFMHRYENISY
jgi:hypothetical protein